MEVQRKKKRGKRKKLEPPEAEVCLTAILLVSKVARA